MAAAPPPGRRGAALRNTIALIRDPVAFLRGMHEQFGDLATLDFIGGETAVYVFDEALCRVAFATDRDIGRAGEARSRFLEPVVGSTSMLVTDGEQWRRHRELLSPPLHGEEIERFATGIGEITSEAVSGWDLSGELQARPLMTEITLEVILRVVFGIAEGDRLERLRRLLPALIAAGSRFSWLPPRIRDRLERIAGIPVAGRLIPGSRFVRLRAAVDEILAAEIAERRGRPDLSGRDDVLSMMIRADDPEHGRLTDEELRDESMTLLAAGHETTATALAWAIERLTRHPEALERLTAEVRAGGADYLDAVIRETLRQRPVVFDVARVLTEPLALGEAEVPAGWYVAPAIAAVHHDPGIWEEPESFRPERFSDGRAPMRSWIPFGGGRRFCVGSHLALVEMRAVLGEVVRRLDLEPTDDPPERIVSANVTIQPRRGARFRARAVA